MMATNSGDRFDLTHSYSGQTNNANSWKTKAALAVGLGVPLGILAWAAPAAADVDDRDFGQIKQDSHRDGRADRNDTVTASGHLNGGSESDNGRVDTRTARASTAGTPNTNFAGSSTYLGVPAQNTDITGDGFNISAKEPNEHVSLTSGNVHQNDNDRIAQDAPESRVAPVDYPLARLSRSEVEDTDFVVERGDFKYERPHTDSLPDFPFVAQTAETGFLDEPVTDAQVAAADNELSGDTDSGVVTEDEAALAEVLDAAATLSASFTAAGSFVNLGKTDDARMWLMMASGAVGIHALTSDAEHPPETSTLMSAAGTGLIVGSIAADYVPRGAQYHPVANIVGLVASAGFYGTSQLIKHDVVSYSPGYDGLLGGWHLGSNKTIVHESSK